MRQRSFRCLMGGLVLALSAFGQARHAAPKAAPQHLDFAAMRDRAFNPGPAPDPAAVARGQKLFVPTCGFCHGPDATGRSAPDLVRSSLVIRDNGGRLIAPIVHGARASKGMPGFAGLTNTQIADISAFLHSRIRAAADRFSATFSEVVSGNAAQGKAFFNGPGGCSGCHSRSGDLAGIAQRMQPAELQATMIVPNGSRPEAVTVTLPSGQSLSGTLISRGHFNIALWDAAGEYHSVPSTGARVVADDPLAAHKKLAGSLTDSEMHDLLAYLETFK